MKHSATPLLSALAAITLLTAGCESKDGSTRTVTGPVTVTYSIQTTPTTSIKDHGTFKEIRFYENHVIMISEDGKGGNAIPIEKINALTWRLLD